jgi:hypothetical protein
VRSTQTNNKGEGPMSNYDYEDEDDFTNDSSDLVKQLRKAAKQKDKELQELRSQFESLNKAQRERAIKDALASRGVNQKIASFIPQDIDPTEESVSKWLSDYADVFGFETAAETQKPSVDPAQARQYQKLTQTADAGFTPEYGDDIMSKLMNAQSREELDEVIRQSGL